MSLTEYSTKKILNSFQTRSTLQLGWLWLLKNSPISRPKEQDRKPRDKHTYGHCIFDKRGKNIPWGKDSLFNNWCWENCSSTWNRMKWEHFLTPYTIINSKWIKDLNKKPETIKLLEENIGRTVSDINHSKILYDPPPRGMEIKTKISTWDLIKLKSFCIAK